MNRHEVLTLWQDGRAAAPCVAATPRGKIVAVYCGSSGHKEWIRMRVLDTAVGKPGKARVVAASRRAFAPRLAVGPGGRVWMAWYGRKGPAVKHSHDNQVYLRRVFPGRPGEIIELSGAPGRDCAPDLSVSKDGVVHVVWEHSDPDDPGVVRVAYRAVSRKGKPLGPAVQISEGPFDRRPSVLALDEVVHVAFDRLVDNCPTGVADPDYDVFMRTLAGKGWGPALVVDGRDGIQAAVDMAPARNGGVLLVYHSSHLHGLVKWWTLRRVRGRLVEQLAAVDEAAVAEPHGEQQGAEFPALEVLPDGRALVFSRPSQGAYLQVVDGSGISKILDLTRKGWGARGRRACTALAPDGTLLIARRGRSAAVLERVGTSKAGATRLVFEEINYPPRKKRACITSRSSRLSGSSDRVFFGDLHMHSALSDGTGSPDEILARAWVRAYDFAVLTDHASIVGRVMAPSMWDEARWLADAFDARDGFCTLRAFEWTTPPLPRGEGHRNVYFRGNGPRYPCGYRSGCKDTHTLTASLKGKEAIAVAHHTGWTGTRWQVPGEAILHRQFEIVSVHGSFERRGEDVIEARGDMRGMFAVDGLAGGHKLGFLGGSDAHGLLWHHGVGRRRDPWAHGLTGVVGKNLSREKLFDAMVSRKTLATSGVFAQAYLTVGGHEMGSEGNVAGPVEIHYQAAGNTSIESLNIVRNAEDVKLLEGKGREIEGSWVDRGAKPGEYYYYLRVILDDGKGTKDMVWSSPVFVRVNAGEEDR